MIGEGPGADEDAQGEPFVGKAGKLMNMAFDMLGVKREEVYIANIVKCRPPNNRNPQDDEAENCLDYLRNQVILVKPKIIVLLGSVALKNVLGKEYGITASRGKWLERKGILYMPTWHPAALLRELGCYMKKGIYRKVWRCWIEQMNCLLNIFFHSVLLR